MCGTAGVCGHCLSVFVCVVLLECAVCMCVPLLDCVYVCMYVRRTAGVCGHCWSVCMYVCMYVCASHCWSVWALLEWIALIVCVGR